MGDTKPDIAAHGWTAEDFVQSVDVDLVEDDPWSDLPDDPQRAIVNSLSVGSQLPLSDVCTTDDTDAMSGGDSSQPTTRTQAEHVSHTPVGYAESEEHSSVGDNGSSYELEDGEFGTELELSLDEFEDDTEFLDEPEPFAEYNSELAEALYDADVDTEIRSIDLRLDELISSIEDSTEIQRDQIYAMLSEFSSRRLSNWLTWLHDQEWTGQSLLLFLELYDLWAATPQWWEYSVWSQWLNRWWTYSNPGTLSRDAAYEVIHQRLHCQADEIIDQAWFRDWDDLALWRYGFSSFASFVVFRAGLSAGEDWRSYLSWESEGVDRLLALHRNFHSNDSEDILDSWVGRIRVWEDDIPYRTYVDGPPLWFAVQDWYDAAEWHDHLGWAINWMNTIHPYLSPETTHTWADYQNDRNS